MCGTRLLLQLFDHRDHLPALAGFVLLPVDRHRGPHMLCHEGLHPAEPFLLAIRHIEIHGAFPHSLAEIIRRALSAGHPSSARRLSPAARITTSGPRACHTDIATFER